MSAIDSWVLCESCRMWRVCSSEYAALVNESENPQWFCCQHPNLENCNSKKQRGDRIERRKQPSMQIVTRWFETSWKHLYIFVKINNIVDYKLDSWSPFLDESSQNYLLKYIREKDSSVCPYGDGKLKYFSLLSKWLIFHDQWYCGMSIYKQDPPV